MFAFQYFYVRNIDRFYFETFEKQQYCATTKSHVGPIKEFIVISKIFNFLLLTQCSQNNKFIGSKSDLLMFDNITMLKLYDFNNPQLNNKCICVSNWGNKTTVTIAVATDRMIPWRI